MTLFFTTSWKHVASTDFAFWNWLDSKYPNGWKIEKHPEDENGHDYEWTGEVATYQKVYSKRRYKFTNRETGKSIVIVGKFEDHNKFTHMAAYENMFYVHKDDADEHKDAFKVMTWYHGPYGASWWVEYRFPAI